MSDRSSLADRLQRLVSRPSSPGSVPASDNAPKDDADMRAVRTAMAKTQRQSRASPDSFADSVRQQLPEPVLRWLGVSPSQTPGAGPSRSPPPSNLAVLDEALHEDLIHHEQHPSHHHPHPPEHFHASRAALARPPPLLDSLARTTLPTASLSQPDDIPTSPFSSASSVSTSPTTSFFSRRPTRRASSVDTLRTLQARSLHTSPPSSIQESTPAARWWFPSFSKRDVDPLLSEEDRQSESPDEAEHLRRKCTRFPNLSSHLPLTAPHPPRPLHGASYRVLPWFTGLRFCLDRSSYCTSTSDTLARYPRSPRGSWLHGSHDPRASDELASGTSTGLGTSYYRAVSRQEDTPHRLVIFCATSPRWRS
jgi:hypothetical protein